MRLFFLLFVSLFAAVVLPAVFVHPVVNGFGIKKTADELRRVEQIELSGKTLFVSDFQLKGTRAGEKFEVDTSGVAHVVIVGDFFFSPRSFLRLGATDEERLQDALETFIPPAFEGDVYFVRGRTHDPVLSEPRYDLGGIRFHNLGEYGRFLIDGVPVLAMHGHQLYQGTLGGGLSWLSKTLGYPVPFERLGRKRLGIAEDTWFVVGHSHVPAILHQKKIANTGSFAGVPFNSFFQIHKGTGILLHNKEVNLIEF